MCQVQEVSRTIYKIGSQSFAGRFKIASPLFADKKKEMEKLLRGIDRLSDKLHDLFPSITERDYKILAPDLEILIDTLKSLKRENASHKELREYNSRLREQIRDLEELNNDIKSFRVEAPKNKLLQVTLMTISKLDLAKYAR